MSISRKTLFYSLLSQELLLWNLRFWCTPKICESAFKHPKEVYWLRDLDQAQYKIFIVFNVLWFGAAIQAFSTYPEICGKTLEEIELIFSKRDSKPWNTKVGGSRIDAEITAVIERKGTTGEDVLCMSIGRWKRMWKILRPEWWVRRGKWWLGSIGKEGFKEFERLGCLVVNTLCSILWYKVLYGSMEWIRFLESSHSSRLSFWHTILCWWNRDVTTELS